MTFVELCKRVREHLGQEHRYAHCVRVARMSENLARVHGADPAKARTAGMLHDLARLYSAERLLRESAEHGVEIDAYAREHPVVLHAPLSARLAQSLFGVDDAQVLSAISKHTLGAGEMSALDCILYLADGLEPGRDYPERENLAALAQRDLREAMRATILSSLRYLTQRHLPIAPQTAAAMETFGLRADALEAGTGGHS
ncbi:MAG TPA: bis(5'-nucleosyl)-tetraphosphatase (symmetrical) YqeK [Candidatus Baltobacteraceae bacterium]|nr:bis(5'-nucleosyl)-tetraphosphatase (symmetrical) YqeK [Candidatus Baltobacteraceae bacterium]